MSLFAKKTKKSKRKVESDSPEPELSRDINDSKPTNVELVSIEESESGAETDGSFLSLGLCDWLLKTCAEMGFKRPTPVQKHCVPAILKGKDILGCAETGSGKTAAFALPILHTLSKDPYGIFALVLTPTRELAVQISEQFLALGAPMSLRVSVIIGGMNFIMQGVELSRRPHIVIATPGRMREHLEGPMAPDFSKLKYLVLDEADRLLSVGFQEEIRSVMESVPKCNRQTLLFSATMTENLMELESLAMTSPVKYDLTKKATVPRTLTQEYLFMPSQVKPCFLVGTLQKLAHSSLLGLGQKKVSKTKVRDDETVDIGAKRIIIFVGTCKNCQEICELLLQLRIDCVCLHSMMSQNRRIAALGKFKSSISNILISTDVSSRGLDIPEVDLVINYNIPRVATDYIHRVGRTARAGRRGQALSLVTQYDIDLVHNIEEYIGSKLVLCETVSEKEVLKLLNATLKAMRMSKLRLMELGFDEMHAQHKNRSSSNKRRKLAEENDHEE